MTLNAEWSVMSFGHGLFQECVMEPILYQVNEPLSNGRFLIVNKQLLSLGIKLSKPYSFQGDIKQFTNNFKQALNSIEFSFQLFLEDGSEIQLETNSTSSSDINESNGKSLHFILSENEENILLLARTYFQIASQYLNLPIKFQLSLNVGLPQGQPFNQRLVTNEKERNLRLLLDLSRHHLPKIPPRVMQVSAVAIFPLKIYSTLREVTSVSSVLTITVENIDPCRDYEIQDVILHKERVKDVLKSNENMSDFGLLDFFQISGMCYKTGNEEDKTVLIHSMEEYTFGFNISLTEETLKSDRFFQLEDGFNGLFLLPCTIHWSPKFIKKSENNFLIPVEPITAVHEYDAIWSIGSNRVNQLPEVSLFSKDSELLPYITNFKSEMKNRNNDTGKNKLSICIEGPTRVFVNRMFELKILITNYSQESLGKCFLVVDHLRNNLNDEINREENRNKTNSNFLVQESISLFSDEFISGSTDASSITILPLQYGPLLLKNIKLYSVNQRALYKLESPFMAIIEDVH